VTEYDFHLHLVSDSTGETLEALVSAALVQFDGAGVQKHFWPLIRTPMQMSRLMQDIREQPGLVMFTLVDNDIRTVLEQECADANLPNIAILDPVIEILGGFLGRKASHLPGKQHMMDREYFARIDAVHYTMAHDDGQMSDDLQGADIVLIGVSRTSKTPTSIYLANKGLKTANVPFVPHVPMPTHLDMLRDKFVMGLTASPERLMAIRTNRLTSLAEDTSTEYTDMEKIQEEIRMCKRYCSERGWPVLDVTRRSIEESAAAILNKYNLWKERHISAAARTV